MIREENEDKGRVEKWMQSVCSTSSWSDCTQSTCLYIKQNANHIVLCNCIIITKLLPYLTRTLNNSCSSPEHRQGEQLWPCYCIFIRVVTSPRLATNWHHLEVNSWEKHILKKKKKSTAFNNWFHSSSNQTPATKFQEYRTSLCFSATQQAVLYQLDHSGLTQRVDDDCHSCSIITGRK